MHAIARAVRCFFACSVAAIAVSSPISASYTFTATGTVYLAGQPVSGKAVSVTHYTALGAGGSQTVNTNNSGVFSASFTGGGTVYYVTVSVDGYQNAIVEQPSRTLSWCCGGTRQFGLWTKPGCPPGPPGDDDSDGIRDAEEDRLLQKFAPRVRLHSGENYYPASVDWVLPRSTMRYSHLSSCSDHEILRFGLPTYGTGTGNDITAKLHQSGSCSDAGAFHPSNSYSPATREGFFLQQHFSDRYGAARHDWVVYGHVYPHRTGEVVVQYWFFYPYNSFPIIGSHQSDWEHVLFVVKPRDGIDDDRVTDVRYSQHTHPQTYSWNDITKVDGRPVVYSAKGSHANYRSHWTLVGPIQLCDGQVLDRCDDDGVEWLTWDTTTFGGVVNVGESCHPRQADWLLYSGRWGEIGNFELTTGKKGPAYQPGFWRYCGSPEICNNNLDDDVDGTLDELSPFCSDPPLPPPPDLTLEDLNPTVNSGGYEGDVVVAPGDSIFVKGAIVNRGGTAGPFTSRFALSTDNVYDATDVELFTVSLTDLHQTTVSGLSPESAHHLPPLMDGVYYLVGKADSTNALAEAFEGEANNTAIADFQVEIDSQALRLENFDDGVANGFTTNAGTWDATGGSYLATETGSDENVTVALVPSSETSVVMDFDFWVTDQVGIAYWPYLGAILRWQDPTHFLRVDTYRNSGTGTSYVRLIAMNGAYQTLANSALAAGVQKGLHHFRIEDRGCQVKVFLDGVQVLTGSYPGPLAPGYRGLSVHWRTQAYFDNFRIRALEDFDHDGWNAACGDCDDANVNVNPGRTENCCTNYDDNCNGTVNENCGSGGCGGGCFAAGTDITMSDGSTRPIEALRPGDEVLSYDEASGKLVPGKVLETYRHEPPDQLVLVNGTLVTAPNHQFFTNRAWLPVDGLMAHDALTMVGEEGALVQQEVTSVERVARPTPIHDIEVSGNHNYFANGVLVHNKVKPASGAPNP